MNLDDLKKRHVEILWTLHMSSMPAHARKQLLEEDQEILETISTMNDPQRRCKHREDGMTKCSYCDEFKNPGYNMDDCMT